MSLPNRKPGFTLIELLVVLAIIAILASMILAYVSSSIERGRRAACTNHLRNLASMVQAAGEDNRNTYPRLHLVNNKAPYWFDQKQRDTIMVNYGLDREICYCPSNRKLWNRDDFWNWQGGSTASVWGYVYLIYDTNWITAYTIRNTERPPEEVFARRLSDSPEISLMFTDINRTLGEWGWFGTGRQGANHMKGGRPSGTNKAYLDGHVEWAQWAEMDLRLEGNGLNIYW